MTKEDDMTKIVGGAVLVPFAVMRSIQGRDFRLRSIEAAIMELDDELATAIYKAASEWRCRERCRGAECRPDEYFVTSSDVARRAESLLRLTLPMDDAPSSALALRNEADAAADDRVAEAEKAAGKERVSKLDKAMDDAAANPLPAWVVEALGRLQDADRNLRDARAELQKGGQRRASFEKRLAAAVEARVTKLEQRLDGARLFLG